MRRLAAFSLIFLFLSHPSASAQSAGIGGLRGGAVVSCLRHKVLCSLTGGAAALAARSTAKDIAALDSPKPACAAGYTPLYRVVSAAEHTEILVIKRYSLLFGGMETKEFWLSAQDADWFASRYATLGGTKPKAIVTSMICADTLRQGMPMTDVNHRAIAFERAALEHVNLDAVRTGGIRTFKAFR